MEKMIEVVQKKQSLVFFEQVHHINLKGNKQLLKTNILSIFYEMDLQKN